jgi:plasmid stabilization system protein ParE
LRSSVGALRGVLRLRQLAQQAVQPRQRAPAANLTHGRRARQKRRQLAHHGRHSSQVVQRKREVQQAFTRVATQLQNAQTVGKAYQALHGGRQSLHRVWGQPLQRV